MAELARRAGWPSITCPIEPARRVALVRRSGALAGRILHPDCLRAGQAGN